MGSLPVPGRWRSRRRRGPYESGLPAGRRLWRAVGFRPVGRPPGPPSGSGSAREAHRAGGCGGRRFPGGSLPGRPGKARRRILLTPPIARPRHRTGTRPAPGPRHLTARRRTLLTPRIARPRHRTGTRPAPGPRHLTARRRTLLTPPIARPRHRTGTRPAPGPRHLTGTTITTNGGRRLTGNRRHPTRTGPPTGTRSAARRRRLGAQWGVGVWRARGARAGDTGRLGRRPPGGPVLFRRGVPLGGRIGRRGRDPARRRRGRCPSVRGVRGRSVRGVRGRSVRGVRGRSVRGVRGRCPAAHRPRCRGEPVVQGIGRGRVAGVAGGVVVQPPPPVVVLTGGPSPLLTHAPDCPPTEPYENGASGNSGGPVPRRTACRGTCRTRVARWAAERPHPPREDRSATPHWQSDRRYGDDVRRRVYAVAVFRQGRLRALWW